MLACNPNSIDNSQKVPIKVLVCKFTISGLTNCFTNLYEYVSLLAYDWALCVYGDRSSKLEL